MRSLIEIVGGPLDGRKIERPMASKVIVPIFGMGICQFIYTLRSCRDVDGHIVELLAPQGEPIDPDFLSRAELSLEN